MQNQFFSFDSDPLRHLMDSCGNKARLLVSAISNMIIKSNVSNLRKFSMSMSYSVTERKVREDARTIDGIKSETNYSIIKFPQYNMLIDVDTRNVLQRTSSYITKMIDRIWHAWRKGLKY